MACVDASLPKYVALGSAAPDLLLSPPEQLLASGPTTPLAAGSLDRAIAAAVQKLVAAPPAAGHNLTILLKDKHATGAPFGSKHSRQLVDKACQCLYAHIESYSTPSPSSSSSTSIPVFRSKLKRPSAAAPPTPRRASLANIPLPSTPPEVLVSYCQLAPDGSLRDLLPTAPASAASAAPAHASDLHAAAVPTPRRHAAPTRVALHRLLARADADAAGSGPAVLTLAVLGSTLTLACLDGAPPRDLRALSAVLAGLAGNHLRAPAASHDVTPLAWLLQNVLAPRSCTVYAVLGADADADADADDDENLKTNLHKISIADADTDAGSQRIPVEEPGRPAASTINTKSQQLLDKIKTLQHEMNQYQEHVSNPPQPASLLSSSASLSRRRTLATPTSSARPTRHLARDSVSSTMSGASTASSCISLTLPAEPYTRPASARERPLSIASDATSADDATAVSVSSPPPLSATPSTLYGPASACHAPSSTSSVSGHAHSRALECVLSDFEQAVAVLQAANARLQAEVAERSRELREMHDMNTDLLVLVEEYEAHVTALIEIDAYSSAKPRKEETASRRSEDGDEESESRRLAARVAALEEDLTHERNEVQMLRAAQKRHASEAQFLTQRYNATCLEADELREENEQLRATAAVAGGGEVTESVVASASVSTDASTNVSPAASVNVLPDTDDALLSETPQDTDATFQLLTTTPLTDSSNTHQNVLPTAATPATQKSANSRGHKRISSLSFFQYRPMTLTKRAMGGVEPSLRGLSGDGGKRRSSQMSVASNASSSSSSSSDDGDSGACSASENVTPPRGAAASATSLAQELARFGGGNSNRNSTSQYNFNDF